jgi:hypothetical protein
MNEVIIFFILFTIIMFIFYYTKSKNINYIKTTNNNNNNNNNNNDNNDNNDNNNNNDNNDNNNNNYKNKHRKKKNINDDNYNNEDNNDEDNNDDLKLILYGDTPAFRGHIDTYYNSNIKEKGGSNIFKDIIIDNDNHIGNQVNYLNYESYRRKPLSLKK